MAEDKNTLTKRREYVRTELNRFIKYFEGFQDEDDIVELQFRHTKILHCLERFEIAQNELELIDEDTDYSKDREEFEDLYYKTVSKADKFIREKSEPTTHEVNANPGAPSPSSHCSDRNSVTVRLPTINLPTFNGKYEEWIPFINSFESLIDSNEQLSDTQKLQYLKGSLKGQAAEALQNLEITSSNYEVGLELLKKQFQNSRLIAQTHIKGLFDLPQVQRDNPSSLRQLVSGTLTHLRALQSLKVNTDNWDPLIIHLVTGRLDQLTHKEWELTTDADEMPTLESLTDYLLKRSQTLESVTRRHPSNTSYSKPSSSSPKPSTNCPQFKNKYIKTNTHVAMRQGCQFCGGNHKTYLCFELKKGSYIDKVKRLNKANVCVNCLYHGHTSDICVSSGCRKCNAKHNTAIHPEEPKETKGDNEPPQPVATTAPAATKSLLSSAPTVNPNVLLNTALVQVTGPTGRVVKCRALLDNGSESSYITEHMAQLLGLHRTRQHIQVSGVNQTSQTIDYITQATITSLVTSYKTNLSLLIIPKITGNIPARHYNSSNFKIPRHITLADSTFDTPSKIDILIGQEVFWDLICIGQIKSPGLPTLQKTKLGWLVCGTFDSRQTTSNGVTSCHLTLDRQLERFWAIEEPTTEKHFTAEESTCEAHYSATTRRDPDGKYMVRMPLRGDPSVLGESKSIAEKRFLQVERRLARDSELKRQYSDFMAEYEELGHMEELKGEQISEITKPEYFLPHHPVLKSTSTTTKLRVVFDASAKTTAGNSLNDLQMVGPTVQPDLFTILMKFRLHTYAFTADIEKMYRQIKIEESQRDLLKILWRQDENKPLKIYKLNTVTYGTASAPWLATRTLQQLGIDERDNFPLASPVVINDFYVDDVLTGTNSLEEAMELQTQLITLLSRAGFHLRKWNSNCSQLLLNLPEHMRERQPHPFPCDDSSIKTLGLWWDAQKDEFQFQPNQELNLQNNKGLTKRTVLSEIARLFDPLGLVGPVVVRAKMQLQELWRLNLSWDESLPMHMSTEWLKLSECLRDLKHLVIPRLATLPYSNLPFDLHGFSDASVKAYGCALYLRHEDENGHVKVSLLSAKSRVSPLKTVSLPRLELCAALLLSELMHKISNTLNVPSARITYWTDSTVVLSWLKSEPAKWTTFVANRVSKIQQMTQQGDWRHVKSEENPADIISRGSLAKSLIQSEMWWSGPKWLSMNKSAWPFETSHEDPIETPEARRKVTSLTTTNVKQDNRMNHLFNKYSTFTTLVRVIAYCLRFTHNTRTPEERRLGPLTTSELDVAKFKIIKSIQNETFQNEITCLQSNTPVSANLQSLAPFLDATGLIRVGGRLDQSELQYETKHPVLLPKNHIITSLIFRDEHKKNLHCGPQALLYSIRQQYWPINGRSLARKVTHECVKCFKAKPKVAQQIMGNLPTSRTTPARCFTNTGVDYCGPFYTKVSRGRGAKSVKTYVCVFICLATKAVHIEPVSDLSTDTFLAALRRFTSRRGMCSEITSDNGRNFVGADRELKELHQFFESSATFIVDAAARKGIRWRFNPPYSPHMGGIWEAAVKSFKHHLKRTAGNASLTIEEFNTLLVQIEAILNSRPLTPMSCDPNDLSVLTPAHFLIGGSLIAVPEPSLMLLPEGRLSRWQRVQQIQQHFWVRWAREYLTNLQQRSKWQVTRTPIHVDALVLLKDDNLPPLGWPMGRVIELHPGRDNKVRVVKVKTSTGVVTRAINKLCPLPLDNTSS